MMEKPKKVHIIGIAGKGMSGLALMLKEAGWSITGSDAGSFGAPVEALRKATINFNTDYKAGNIPMDANLIIIGKHAKLTNENPEVAAALASGIPTKNMAQVIGEMASKHKQQIVVAGSYAKSTCTSLLAWCLRENNLNPSYFIGASPLGFETTAHLGEGNYFVAEGDEYPSSNTDTTSKFLYMKPDLLLLTSGEHDHVTVFPTIESYLAPYRELLGNMSRDAVVVGCIDNPNVSELLEQTKAKIISYGLAHKEGWHAKNISAGTFELWSGETKIADMTTHLIGDYNIQNIVGVSALLIENNILSAEQVAASVATFRGVRGRLDLKNPGATIPVYESYGSSYTKAKSSIEALLKQHPDKQLHIIFEPHTFTWRDPSQSDAYRDVFAGAQSVILYQTPSAHGKKADGQLSLEEIKNLVARSDLDTSIAETPEQALAQLEPKLTNNAMVLIITSGEIGGLTKSVPELIQRHY